MNYKEEINFAEPYRKKYLAGINKIIFEREEEANVIRGEFCKEIQENPEKYRSHLKEMLGWPLNTEDKSIPSQSLEMLSDEAEYTVYRASFEVMTDVVLTGILFKQKNASHKYQ